MELKWSVPSHDLSNVYKNMGLDVSWLEIDSCMALMYAGGYKLILSIFFNF